MENGQPKTATEAIPLLPLPLPPELDIPLNLRHQELPTAVMLRDVQSVKRHLAEGAPLILTFPEGDISILYFCIEEYTRDKACRNYCRPDEMEIIQEILAAVKQHENKRYILNTLDELGHSPLYLAIKRGYFQIVEALIKSEANVGKVSDKYETALHVAVDHPDMLKYLLDNHEIEFSYDTRGYTPIHAAAQFDEVDSIELLIKKFGKEVLYYANFDGLTVLHVAAEHGSTKLVDILIGNPNKPITYTDLSGKTALYRSAKHGHTAVAALLLCNGAVLSDKGYIGERRTAVEQIARKFPDPLKFFEEVFDEFITVDDMDKKRMLRVDYKVLTNSDDESMSQIEVIEELVRCGQSKLLLHPLIESLLYLKWRCLLPAFCTIIAIYAFFLVSFNAFLVTTFYKRDYNATNSTNCSNSFNESNLQCHKCFDVYDWVWIIHIYLSIFLLLGQKCFYIYRQRCRYFNFTHLEPWVKFFLPVLAAMVPPGLICGEPEPWLRNVSCAALLLSWLQAMYLLSRFPVLGHYVLMFERVAYNMLTILPSSICLVIGFSFCYMIQYRSESPFDGPEAAFVKTLVMMSSEFDYKDLFAEEHKALEHTRSIVRLLFVIFIIFIAIVLMNFMTGIAVSDISELNKIGNIRRLEKQVELQSTLGVLVDTVHWKIFKCSSRFKFHRHIFKYNESEKKWLVWYGSSRVLDCGNYYHKLTSDRQDAIINVAKRKAQRKEDNRNKDEKKNRLDVMYDTIMKLERDRQEDGEKALDENKFYKNTEASNSLMQSKMTSLEISMNEIKENMNKILAIMTGDTTPDNKRENTLISGRRSTF